MGFYRARAERDIPVKGLVEHEVKADLAVSTIICTALREDQYGLLVAHDLVRDPRVFNT